jgi:hypothetical protein
LRAELGPKARVLSLDARPERVALQVEDEKARGQVLEYEVKGGSLSQPVRAELRGSGSLDANLFPFRSVSLERLSEMMSQAVAKIDAGEGKVERVLLRRQLPHSSEARFRIYVESPRVSGHVDFEADGRIVSSSTP